MDVLVDGVNLVGTTTVQIGEDGFAKFFDLGIEGSSSGKQLALEFYLDGEGLEICVSIFCVKFMKHYFFILGSGNINNARSI